MPNAPTLQLNAGEHPRVDCPVWLPIPEGAPDDPLALVDPETGARLPAQRIGDQFVAILDNLERGRSRSFRLESADSVPAGVTVAEREAALEFAIGGAPFTVYHVGREAVRPYFYPLLGPGGVALTRNYPMVADVSGESCDHPHHRSLYVAFGEVNGVNVWAEPPASNVGRIVHQGWENLAVGSAAADVHERLRWEDNQGVPLLDERRRVTIYNTRSIRLLDLEIALTPSSVAVFFADTKEGGPLALRVASAIEGKRGGLIQNAYGGRRERETWGKRAPWVDYSGEIDRSTVGVAIMDHPTSFRHPTYWHVRDYGLFAANPFGISAFTNDPGQRGDYILPPGQTLTFRYRLCLHYGNADAARIAERYHDYANPPAVVL